MEEVRLEVLKGILDDDEEICKDSETIKIACCDEPLYKAIHDNDGRRNKKISDNMTVYCIHK